VTTRGCRCGGTFELDGEEFLDSDGTGITNTRCPSCGCESAAYRHWQDDLFGDLDPYSDRLVAGIQLRSDLAGRDVCVVATEGPDDRFLSVSTLRDAWSRQPYLRGDEGGPFRPDTEEDDLAPASHFYLFDIPARTG
jgi:hypothetical protein